MEFCEEFVPIGSVADFEQVFSCGNYCLNLCVDGEAEVLRSAVIWRGFFLCWKIQGLGCK